MKKIQFELTKYKRHDTGKLYNMGVYLVVNGNEYMQLDTGAATTAILDSYAKSLGYDIDSLPYDIYPDENLNDKKFHYIEDFKFKIDGYDFTVPKSHVEIVKHESKDKTIKKYDYPFRGYLGMDIFQKDVIVFNYIDNCIEFLTREDEIGDTFDFVYKYHIILPFEINGKTYRAMYDTATAESAITMKRSFYDTFDGEEIDKDIEAARPDFPFEKSNKKVDIKYKLAGKKYCEEHIITAVNPQFEEYIYTYDSFDFIIGNAIFKNKKLYTDLEKSKFNILE